MAQVDLLGHLVAGNILMTERYEADRLHRVPRTWDYHRVHRFSPPRIGHPEDGGFQDGRVFVEDFFDLGTVDVLAARDDHIFGAIDEENIALGMHVTEIPTVIPAVTEGRGGLLGFVPVSWHDIRATHDHFADLARRQVVATQGND